MSETGYNRRMKIGEFEYLRLKKENDPYAFRRAMEVVNRDLPMPESWPECPYPESVFPMTDDEYVKAIPDERLRTAISGYLYRHGWNVASKQIYEKIKEQ